MEIDFLVPKGNYPLWKTNIHENIEDGGQNVNTLFVILHYLTLNDTLEAVASIKRYEKGSRIVIVDNASGNGTFEKLEEKYKDDSCVDVISSPSNVGFAKGNNFGIKYAREHYSPDFICLINNDILLIEEISSKIEREYARSHFSVLGPMIYTADGRCNDNPGRSQPMGKEELQVFINYLDLVIFANKIHIGSLCESLYNGLRKIRRKYRGKKTDNSHKTYLNREENVQLHGCFLVLSERFFEYFDGLYSGTFLYMEEDILFWQLMQKNLTSVYLPDIHVFHKEDSASKAVWSSDRKRALVKQKICLDSARAFEKLMKENA